MKKITLLFASTVLSICAFAQGSVTYTFDSVKTTSGITDPSFVPTVPGLTFGSFIATGTPPNSLAAARFDFADWALGSTGGIADSIFSGMTGTVNTSEYYEVTITPNSGYMLDVDSIQFSFERSGTGVRAYCVRSSADAYTANLNAVYGLPFTPNVTVLPGNIFFLRKDITTPQNRNIIVLGGTGFIGLTTPITFRFYAWDAEAPSGTFSLDNVRFSGNSTTVATGIIEKNNSSVSIYPNPSSNGLFTIDAGTGSTKTMVSVYNIIGKVVYTKEISSKQMIDLSNQGNGSYFVTIKNENEVITKKIIINK